MFRLMMLLAAMVGTAEASDPVISVLGEGVVTATPDIFYLDINVNLSDTDLTRLQTDVSERCQRIVAAAKKFELDPARTFTRDFSIVPQFDNSRKFIGYMVNQRFRFALVDLNQAESLTTAVLKAGATTIDKVEFSVKETEELWEQARDASMENALRKATRMTKVLASKPGRPLRISDQGNRLVDFGCDWNGQEPGKAVNAGGGLPDGDRVHFVPPTAVKFHSTAQVDFSIVPLEPEPVQN